MPRNVKEIPSFVYDPSCVLYLPLWKRDAKDGDSFISDDAYGHLCTVTGATWGIQGRTFTNSTNNILLGTNPPLTGNDITIWGWARATTGIGANRVIEVNGQTILYFQTSDSTLECSQGAVSNSGTFTLDTLHHFAVTYKASPKVVNFFVDGQPSGTADQAYVTAITTGTTYIGNRSAGDRPWVGVLRELGITTRLLTAQEVQHNYLVTKRGVA